MNAAAIVMLHAAAIPQRANLQGQVVRMNGVALASGEERSSLSTITEANPDLWLYRDRTLGMLRRYLRLSIEVGRLPSLLGREFFRTRVTSYKVATFEDAVIFVHDVERSFQKSTSSKKTDRKDRTAGIHARRGRALAGLGRRTVGRRFPEALDRLSETFLATGLLTPMPRLDCSP